AWICFNCGCFSSREGGIPLLINRLLAGGSFESPVRAREPRRWSSPTVVDSGSFALEPESPPAYGTLRWPRNRVPVAAYGAVLRATSERHRRETRGPLSSPVRGYWRASSLEKFPVVSRRSPGTLPLQDQF